MRSWDGGTDGGGTWYVTVTGIVSNRTGAATDVDAVAVVFARADGSTYEVPGDERPLPTPRTIADRAEATWRFEGRVPAGAEPVDVTVAVGDWRWTDPPGHCP